MIQALQDECEFYFCLNQKKQWSERDQRPIPENIKFVTEYEPGKYDLAILHVDQQVISPRHKKRKIFDQFDKIIQDIPKIIINHGTPVYPEGFIDPSMSFQEREIECISRMKRIIGTNTMVVNSHTSASEQEWGFGYPIVHGINPSDWLDIAKEPRVFTAMSPVGLDVYYNRDCMIKTAEELFSIHGYKLWYAKVNVATHVSLDTYKDFLGRSLLYLDTSYRTPMNRARTEAFLSGCCVIQVEGAHDLERWACPGENIVLVPNDPKEIAKVVVDFIENKYWEAVEIGQKGKKMAINNFSQERYKQDWLKLINKTLNRDGVYE